MGAAGRRVMFRPAARMGTIAASLAAAAVLLLPNAALAATPTQIGSAQGNQACMLTADAVQASSIGPSYAIPTGGTFITDWIFQAGSTDTGSVNLLVWRPVDVSTLTYSLIYISPTVNLSDPLRTFALPGAIPVLPGDLIGLRLTGSLTCVQGPVDPANVVGFKLNSTAAVGDQVSFTPGAGLQLNVAATVEVTVNPPPPPPTPTSADQCKDGGWQSLTDSQGTPFKNQGDCVSFVATDGTNAGNGAATVTPAPPPPPPSTPTSADQCQGGGWQNLADSNGTPFKNQGDCVSFVAPEGTNGGSAPPT